MKYRRINNQKNNINRANNTKENKQILLKKQKSFINPNKNNILSNLNNINSIEKSYKEIFINTSSRNNMNQTNHNENHSGENMYNNNIKKNISFDNNLKRKNRKNNINLKKDNYNNLFYRNDKNFSKQKFFNKSPEPKRRNKNIIINFTNYQNEAENLNDCKININNLQTNKHKIFNYNYINNTQQNRNKSQDIDINKIKKEKKRKKNNKKIENYHSIQTVNNKAHINTEKSINNNLINTSNDYNYKNTNLKNTTFNYNNNFNNMNNENILWNIIIKFNQSLYNIIISPYKTIGDLLNEIFLKLYHLNIEFFDIFCNFVSLRKVDKSLKIYQLLKDDSIINIIKYKNLNGKGYILLEKEINIKFIELDKSKYENNYDFDFNLHGLLKLCLLKEISLKLDSNRIAKLPLIISTIMEILKNGKIESTQNKECIKEVMNKIRGSNITNFSRYVDKIIGLNYLQEILRLLNENELYEINSIKNKLKKYNQYITFFEKEFEKSKKNSIFEFSIISLVIMERENLVKFEKERKKCPNRVDKILYHGTGVEPISSILTTHFEKEKAKVNIFGEGFYHTDSLDYCWYYGGNINNRENVNKIPKVDETFSFIASLIYYSEEGLRKVNNSRYNPKKNEINIAFADAYTGIYELYYQKNKENRVKFNEYVINDLNQICPFISAKLKRDEFCVIWRDINFSNNPVYDQFHDTLFKNFLKKRVEYIENLAKFNIYLFNNSEEALEVIKKKKYNKIILISNVGTDYGGKKFISEARKILESDVIALFLAYNENHLNWIKNFKNAFFSNEPEFYERYLRCFEQKDERQIIDCLNNLKEIIEAHYSVKLNFDDKFLE